jgi:hypothetical protein
MSKQNYRFSLLLNDEVITERIFSADSYNPEVNGHANIRDMAVEDPNSKDAPTEIMRNFQQILSLHSSKLSFIINGYDTLKYHKRWLASYGNSESLIRRKSEGGLDDKGYYQNPDEKFKFVLYLNDVNLIERNFLVKRFNPESRFSVELTNYLEDVVHNIQNFLRDKSNSFMYEEYDITNKYNMEVSDVKLLSKEERKRLLNKIYNN